MAERNAERTKTAILEAAEDLFARQGFERTSLHEIAAAAGFARSTPAYFFKTKQQLYDTVLENALERGRAAMRPAFEAAIGAPSSERALDTIVGDVLAFLAHDEKYVLIMQREALAPRPSLAALLTEPALAEARMGSRTRSATKIPTTSSSNSPRLPGSRSPRPGHSWQRSASTLETLNS
jgi:AcrR family transcriptional regulator